MPIVYLAFGKALFSFNPNQIFYADVWLSPVL